MKEKTIIHATVGSEDVDKAKQLLSQAPFGSHAPKVSGYLEKKPDGQIVFTAVVEIDSPKTTS